MLPHGADVKGFTNAAAAWMQRSGLVRNKNFCALLSSLIFTRLRHCAVLVSESEADGLFSYQAVVVSKAFFVFGLPTLTPPYVPSSQHWFYISHRQPI